MIYFVEENRRDLTTRLPHGPVVVHCSAGIGRTGCFIAISLGLLVSVYKIFASSLLHACPLFARRSLQRSNSQFEISYLSGLISSFLIIPPGMQQLIKENCVDILGIVCRLRKDRGGMIQTSEQYEFIYIALAAFEKSMQVRIVKDERCR